MKIFAVRKMRKMIKEWLIKEGIFKEEVSDENAEFHYIVEVPPASTQLIDIVQPKGTEIILVASGIKLSDEHYKAVMELSEKEREDFMWGIRFGLLFLPTEFQIIPDSKNPQLFQFTRKLYVENIERQRFIDAIAEVHKCKLFIIWKLNQKFGGKKIDEIMFR